MSQADFPSDDPLRKTLPVAPPPPDQGIPMLTDVLHVPRYNGSDLPANLSEVSWPELSLKVQENVMERLMRRSGEMLEDQLQQTLQVVLDRHLQTMSADLNDALTRLVRELVARAVADELTRVHTEITHRRRAADSAA